MKFQHVPAAIQNILARSSKYLCRIFSSSVGVAQLLFPIGLLFCSSAKVLAFPVRFSLSLSLSLSSSCSRHFLPAVCFSSPLPRSPGFCPGHVSYSPIFYSLPPAISFSLSLSPFPASSLCSFSLFFASAIFVAPPVFTTRCLVSHVRPCVSPVFTKVSLRAFLFPRLHSVLAAVLSSCREEGGRAFNLLKLFSQRDSLTPVAPIGGSTFREGV